MVAELAELKRKKTDAEKASRKKKKVAQGPKCRRSGIDSRPDQKKQEQAPQTGRGADRNARKKPSPYDCGLRYFPRP